MNRTDFQHLADVRTAEAAALLAAGHWDGAYYLAGYAVECGLKACILAFGERTGVIFQEKDYSARCFTHEAGKLLELAGLKGEWETACKSDPQFGLNWSTTARWSVESRYARITEAAAREPYAAITDPAHGVLAWIRNYW